MTTFTAIANNVIFQFHDRVNTKGEFEQADTAGGISLISTADSSAKQPRWATVVAAGPTAKVRTGDKILIPALRWTNFFEVGGTKFWKTDDGEIAAVIVAGATKLTARNSFIIFARESTAPIKTTISGLLFVSRGSEDGTEKGVSLAIGEDVDPVLDNVRIHITSGNMVESFTHGAQSIQLVKQADVFAYEHLN